MFSGDNTFNPDNNTPVNLVNTDNQFHSIYTTVEDNGLAGMQILPREASLVYFNCIGENCLLQENIFIR